MCVCGGGGSMLTLQNVNMHKFELQIKYSSIAFKSITEKALQEAMREKLQSFDSYKYG